MSQLIALLAQRRASLALLVGLVLLVGLARFPLADRQFRLDVGSEGPLIAPDATSTVQHFLGFYAPEQAGGDSFRWTDSWARLLVPHAHRLGRPLLLQLRACGCRPSGAQPTAQLVLNNRPAAALPMAESYRTYTLLVPPGGGDLGSDLFIELFSPTANFDGRPVGLRLDWLELRSWPQPALDWPLAAALALLGALIATLVIAPPSPAVSLMPLVQRRATRPWVGKHEEHEGFADQANQDQFAPGHQAASQRRAANSLAPSPQPLASPVPSPRRPALLASSLQPLAAGLLLGPLLILALYRRQELEPAALVLAELWGVLCVALARPQRRLTTLGLLALVLALPYAPQLLGSWVVDDAFISFRYAQQLVAGHGLVFNPGERVEGYTNFLWTVLVAGMLRLGSDPVYLVQIVTLLLAQATLVLCFMVGCRLVAPAGRWAGLLALAAPLLLALNGPFLLYSARGSGLETALFGLLLLASVAALLAGRLAWCGALLALTTMTRPDGVVALAVLGGCALLVALPERRWRGPLTLVGTFLALFLPYYLWRYSYYGLPLPNTFYVKVGASTAQLARGLRYLADYWQAAGWAWPLGLLALTGTALWCQLGVRRAGWQARRPGRPAAWLAYGAALAGAPGVVLLLLTLAYSAYIVAVGGDWMPGARFVAPLAPLLALLAQAGLARLARIGRVGPALVLALLALALTDQLRATVATSASDASNEIWRENSVVARRREVGRWLKHNSPPDALVAVEAAGALPYYSERPAIDILGLNDRHIASVEVSTIGQGKPGHEKTDIPYVLSRQPAIIPYFSVPYFAGQPEFEQGYTRRDANGPEGYTVILYWRKTP